MIASNHFGPLISPENVIFRLWAPGAQRVQLVHDKTHEMQRSDDGWFKLTIRRRAARRPLSLPHRRRH